MISTQESKKPLFVTIFYHGYHLSYVQFSIIMAMMNFNNNNKAFIIFNILYHF